MSLDVCICVCFGEHVKSYFSNFVNFSSVVLCSFFVILYSNTYSCTKC